MEPATIMSQVLANLRAFVLYIIPCLAILLPLYRFGNVPKHVFRKLLHMVAVVGITLMLVGSESWIASVLILMPITVVLYPLLALLERKPWFEKLFVQKSQGEVKRSMLFLFGMFTLLTVVACGFLQKTYAAAAAILMWGIGDAMAALVGVPYGKHKVTWKLTDGKKSWEGTIAMFASATAVGALVLILSAVPLEWALVAAVAGGAIGALIELISPSEYDTITVPIGVFAVLLLLV